MVPIIYNSGMSDFKLTAPFSLSGDQGSAVAALSAGVNSGQRSQVLLGVTGSGKTFTIANVIAKTQRALRLKSVL